MDSYQVVGDFQAGAMRVLVLDRDYSFGHTKLKIDGVEYPYTLNSISNWVIIKSNQSFAGKTAMFM